MTNKEIDQLLRTLRAQGFQTRRAQSGHWRVSNAKGECVSLSSTPGKGNRAMQNMRAKLRKIGARV